VSIARGVSALYFADPTVASSGTWPSIPAQWVGSTLPDLPSLRGAGRGQRPGLGQFGHGPAEHRGQHRPVRRVLQQRV